MSDGKAKLLDLDAVFKDHDLPVLDHAEPEDPVNHPRHYTSHPSGVECIQITRHYGFNIGCAIKYLWRSELKGAPIQDLEKAVFYIQDEIAKRKSQEKQPCV